MTTATERRPAGGTWGEVQIGTVIADPTGRAWEVVKQAYRPGEPGPWNRIRAVEGGEEHTLPPKAPDTPVMLLVDETDDMVALLGRVLGAQVLASRDEITGAVFCPTHDPVGQRRLFLEHLRFGHGLSVDDDLGPTEAVALHDRAHITQAGGFEHAHER